MSGGPSHRCHRADRKLTLFQQGRPIRAYTVALGRNPTGPKVSRGDGRTPEGLYRVEIGAVISFFLTFDNFLPGSWDSAPDEYPWFIISTLLGQLALPAQLAVAEKLRFSRDARWLQWLRAFLWVDLALSVTETGIDSRFFPDALLLDALSILWPAIWIPYFYFSKRVKRVFKISEVDMTAV